MGSAGSGKAATVCRVAEADIGPEVSQQLQTLLQASFPGFPSRTYYKLPPHFRYLAMTGDAVVGQVGVELRMIRVGGQVFRTFGVVDLCVRENERSRGLASMLLRDVTELARTCAVEFVILFADDDRLYLRNGWARAANTCSWLKIHEHRTVGLATAVPTGALLVKAIGAGGWPAGDVDLLGHLF